MAESGNWHERSFFGLHYDLHANADDTELGLELTARHLREELEKCKPDFVQCDCKGHPGYTSYPTEVGTPSPGIRRDALRVIRRVTREMGVPLSIHYSGLWDDVAGARHPRWRMLGPDGAPLSRAKMCMRSPYLEKLMIPQLHEVIAEYDIDGIWVDGDCWCCEPCYCPRCRKSFEGATGHRTPERPEDEHWFEWLRFHRETFEAYVDRYVEAVKARKPSCLVCSNWLYTARAPGPMGARPDWLSGDAPPRFAQERISLESRYLTNRGMAWDLMLWTFRFASDFMHGGASFKTFEQLAQEAAGVVMHGGSLFLYNQPKRSGRRVPWQHDTMARVARFVRQRRSVCKGAESVPQVALLHSEAHYYRHNSPSYGFGAETPKPLFGALATLVQSHYHFDVLDEAMLTPRIGEFGLVVVPEQTDLSPAMRRTLMAYARAGGRVLLTGETVARDFSGHLGVRRRGAPRHGRFFLPGAGGADAVECAWQFVTTTGAKALAPLLREREPDRDGLGTPAVTIHNVGKGRVAAVHGPIFAVYGETRFVRVFDFLREILREIAPPQKVTLDAPEAVEMALRRKNGRLIVHLLNRGTSPALTPNSESGGDVPPVGPIRVKVRLPRRPKKVALAPGRRKAEWTWRSGAVHAVIPSLHIHCALVLE